MDKPKKKKLYNLARIIAIVLLLLFIIKGVVLLVVLIGLSLGLSFIINHFPIRQIGIELVTFIAILSGMKYGPWTALLITFVLITYHMIAGGFIGNYVFWVIPAYCVAAVIAGFMPLADIGQLGIYATFAINASNLIFTAFTGPGYIPRYIPYAVTNIIFNIFIFTLLGRPMLLLIG